MKSVIVSLATVLSLSLPAKTLPAKALCKADTFGFSSDIGSILLLNVESSEGGYSTPELPRDAVLFNNGYGDGTHTAYIFHSALNMIGLKEFKRSLIYLGYIISNGQTMIHEYDADPHFGNKRFHLLAGAWNIYNNGEGSIILEYMSDAL